jgi:hypothetical protein
MTISLMALSVIVIAVGCASIMKGTKQTVSVSSSPSAATVKIKTTGGVLVFEGVTPATTSLPKNKEYLATISLEGYKDATSSISKEGIEGWFWGNLICGGIIGIVIDLTNGAMNSLGPDQIHVELVHAQVTGEKDAVYAVLTARDSQGQLRRTAIPMVSASEGEAGKVAGR